MSIEMRIKKKEMEEFYGAYYVLLEEMEQITVRWLVESSANEIEHIKSRIKAVDSVKNKLERLHQVPDLSNARGVLTDVLGIRIICRFWDDVYRLASLIEANPMYTHRMSKDYILSPKENGYRSYHIILDGHLQGITIPIEIQIRTISQDTWASLEHKLKYKQDIKNEKLIKKELKRLADEMVSADLCMQAIKELIEREER